MHIDLQPFQTPTNANLVIYYYNVRDVTRLAKARAASDRQTFLCRKN